MSVTPGSSGRHGPNTVSTVVRPRARAGQGKPELRSPPQAKPVELAGEPPPLGLDLSDPRPRWTGVTPGEQPVQPVPVALSDQFHVAVVCVANPARDAEAARFVDRRVAEANPLDPPADAYDDPRGVVGTLTHAAGSAGRPR